MIAELSFVSSALCCKLNQSPSHNVFILNSEHMLWLQEFMWPMMDQSKSSRILLLMTFYYFNAVPSDFFKTNVQGGILYPRESESREVKLLDGIWNFRLSQPDSLIGFKEKWFLKDLSKVSPNLYLLQLI